MTRLITSNGAIWIKVQYFNGLLRHFVPRKDDTRVPSLRACEAIQKNQNINTLLKLVIGRNEAIYYSVIN